MVRRKRLKYAYILRTTWVEISLRTKANPIGVSTYELYPELPSAYEGKLPTAEDLQVILAFKSQEL